MIAFQIKQLSKQQGKPINKMLSQCEINKSFIYDLEKKEAIPSIDKLIRIADYFDVSIDYLLGRTETHTITQPQNTTPKYKPDIHDELFKNYLYFIDNFSLEKLIHKNAEEFKQALIDINQKKKDMNLDDFEYLFQIISESHQLSLKSSILIYKELLSDYHTWLVGNYYVTPKNP